MFLNEGLNVKYVFHNCDKYDYNNKRCNHKW